MLNILDFIHPENELLKYRIAQKLAHTRPTGYYTKPSLQDFASAEAILKVINTMITYHSEV